MFEFNLQHCHELLNVHIFMIASVSATARTYLGGRRGGGSVFVGGGGGGGGAICVCVCVGGGVQMRGNGCSVIQKTMLHVELQLISLILIRTCN